MAKERTFLSSADPRASLPLQVRLERGFGDTSTEAAEIYRAAGYHCEVIPAPGRSDGIIADKVIRSDKPRR